MSKDLPILVAELSANHCGKLEKAKSLIKTAKRFGADAVKLQTYSADSMTLKSNKKYFRINEGLWKGYNLWDLFNEGHTPYTWHKELFALARKIKIKIFSTPFDHDAVDFLEKLNCPIYKVASFEMTDHPLIKKIASTQKPMIISTGMASLREIHETYNLAIKNGAKEITLLYCVSKYPAENDDFSLNNISILKSEFGCKVGLSDHSKDINVTRSAIALGASVIEKHIALPNQKNGLDIKFSIKGKEIKDFKNAIIETHKLVNKDYYFRSKSEEKSKIHRRSIFVVNDVKKGEKFTSKNIRRIRPGNGVEPKYYNKILSQVSPVNIKRGQPFSKSLLQKLKIK